MIITDFGDLIAERMRVEHRALATRWLDRLLDLLPVDAKDVFPSSSLLDHIPALIVEISGALRDRGGESIAANTAIIDKARELGTLRHTQRASLHQVVREYQILGAVLVTFVTEEIERLAVVPPVADCVLLVSQLHRAVNVLSQATVETFIDLYTRTIAEQTERLEQFARMATHEWRQPLGVMQFGIAVLREADLPPERFHRTLDSLDRNVTRLVDLTRKVETLARMHGEPDVPSVQQVTVTTIANEAARQLRDMAASQNVDVRVVESNVTITVDVGRLELVFVNLVSNAIKYSDAAKDAKYVEITATPCGEWCELRVIDNGIGIPESALSTVFRRFTRAHVDSSERSPVGGMGLGLAIVDDCVLAMGGRIDLESIEGQGTAFRIRLPLRANVR